MLIYIDETGDHNLNKIDPQYPIFGLGALVISEENYVEMDSAIHLIKEKFFKDDGTFILHSSELKRPLHSKSDPRNRVMLDEKTRKAFYKELDEKVISAFDFKIIACFIKKHSMADKYKYPVDPYYFSFENLLNRVIRYGDDSNVMFAEKRGLELDTELISEYERLSKVGIHSFSADIVTSKTSLKLIHKKANVNGLQLIDLILSCLIRSRQGKRDKMKGNDLLPEFIEKKLACAVTVFPKKTS